MGKTKTTKDELNLKKEKTLKKLSKLKDKYCIKESKEKYQIKLRKLLSLYDCNNLSIEYNNLRKSEITSQVLRKFKRRVTKLSEKLKKHYEKKA